MSAGFGVFMDRAKRNLDSIMTIRFRSHGYIYVFRALEVHLGRDITQELEKECCFIFIFSFENSIIDRKFIRVMTELKS